MPRFRDLIPQPVRPAARSLYYVAYRRKLALEFWLRDRLQHDPSLPPSRLRFRVGESADPAVFVQVGRQAAENIEHCLQTAGHPIRHTSAVLDFGCGCGRTLSWLTRRHPHVQWHGSDVDAEAIEWCRRHLPGRYETNRPFPPLAFDTAVFDAIIGLSVFTHLDHPQQLAWVPELRRVLKPGGVLLLSFYSEQVWRSTEEASSIDQGKFVFRRSAKLKGILPEWYQTAFQNRVRIQALLHSSFASVEILSRGLGDHDAVIAR